MTNVEMLEQARVLPTPNKLSQSDVDKVNALSCDEVQALCNIKAQLGDDFIERNTCLIL